MIVLISSFADLKKFNIRLKKWQETVLKKFWPSVKASFILPLQDQEFAYLHRNSKTLAFRFPKNDTLSKILSVSGPIVAPSANWEGHPPAKTAKEAKKYFKNSIFYLNKGRLNGKASAIINLTTKNSTQLVRTGCLNKQKIRTIITTIKNLQSLEK
jgi:L-threonylcarbamoyladenylate synthase